MKNKFYVLILLLVVISGLVFANREIKNETPQRSTQKPLTETQKKVALKKWQSSPDGLMYQKWKDSPAGKKVFASEAKISKSIKNFTDMEAVVTSLSLPKGSRLGFGIMVRINDEDYILTFRPQKPRTNTYNFDSEFEQLYSLKVNDKIIIRSRYTSHAPKYSYSILSGDYVEKDSKVIYKRTPQKDGC